MDGFALSGFLMTLTMLLSVVRVAQGLCRSCPFQWREYQDHCYRYDTDPSLHDSAKSQCRTYSSYRSNSAMAEVSGVGELVFLMNYASQIFELSTTNQYVWLDKEPMYTIDDLNLAYLDKLGGLKSSDGEFSSCNMDCLALSSSGCSTTSGPGAVEDNECASSVSQSGYLRLVYNTESCVTDPDSCTSGSLTWSLWVKIDTNNSISDGYLVAAGGWPGRRLFEISYDLTDIVVKITSLRQLRTWTATIPMTDDVATDSWFNLAVVLTSMSGTLKVYQDGTLKASQGYKALNVTGVSTGSRCNHLYLGTNFRCGGETHDYATTGTDAAFSNLMVFENVLTYTEILSLYRCGSLDTRLKVRSLYRDDTFDGNGEQNSRYVCKASASSGPVIYWKVYKAEKKEWNHLASSGGGGYSVEENTFSPCVVQSALVVDLNVGPHSSLGDIIACTATDGLKNASVYIRQGSDVHIGYSDHLHGGLFASTIGMNYNRNGFLANIADGSLAYPFICEKETIRG